MEEKERSLKHLLEDVRVSCHILSELIANDHDKLPVQVPALGE